MPHVGAGAEGRGAEEDALLRPIPKVENCLRTSALPHFGQSTARSPMTSSSKAAPQSSQMNSNSGMAFSARCAVDYTR